MYTYDEERIKEMRDTLAVMFAPYKKNGEPRIKITHVYGKIGISYWTLKNFMSGKQVSHGTLRLIDDYLKSNQQ